MKAVVCTKYGPPEVLKLRDYKKPVPKDNEVCIKIKASAVTMSDVFIRSSQLPLQYIIPMRIMLGITKPRMGIIGIVLSGEIESAGKDIKRFKPGDQVYGLTGFSLGCYAEYKCMKEVDSKRNGSLALKPNNLSHEEATAAAYGGLLGFQYLEKGNISKGQKVLIYGASGTTGTMAVQYAKALGAEVTGVCSNRNLKWVKSLGADKVLDYTDDKDVNQLEKYNLILDAVGKAKTSKLKKACKKSLKSDGIYISIDDGDLELKADRLERIKDFVEVGKVMPVVDKTYPIEQIVEAHHYVGSGHKKGGVAVTL